MAITNNNVERDVLNNTNTDELVVFQSNADELGISGGGGGGGAWSEATVSLTSAQILSLNGGGSIQLLSAPEAGKVRVVKYALFKKTSGTTYTVGGSTAYLSNNTDVISATYSEAIDNDAFQNDAYFLEGAPTTYPTEAIYIATLGTHTISGGSGEYDLTVVYKDF